MFGVTLFGSLDVWRYLAYALPAVAILYAQGPGQYDWRIALPWTAAVTAMTQQPWAAVTDEQYFTDWFPSIGRCGITLSRQHSSFGHYGGSDSRSWRRSSWPFGPFGGPFYLQTCRMRQRRTPDMTRLVVVWDGMGAIR